MIIEQIDSYAATDKVAYITEMEEMSYKQLKLSSDKLAAKIHMFAGEDKTPIIVYGHKDVLMIVSFLACVKSGRAYCPIDTSVPLIRVTAIINEVKPKLILSIEDLECNLDSERTVWNNLEIKEMLKSDVKPLSPSNWVQKNDIFYIIFTSGSTGIPKGVQITRDCLENFLNWATELGNLKEYDKTLIFLNQAPFSFDLSVMDLYISLSLGGILYPIKKDVQMDMKKLLSALKKSNADVWVSTPTFADMCLADHSFNKKLLPYLKLFLFCGETLHNQTVSKLYERFDNAKVVNTYGPTETTVAVTDVLVTKEMNNTVSPLPVGIPKPNTWILIMDKNKKIMEDGKTGEIVIVGDTVSAGYYNKPELTAKIFDTYTIEDVEYGLYHTGDEGYIVNGMLYYTGRMDNQIKLHGYRIEIEDIENNILKISGVKKVVVIPVRKQGEVRSLKAAVIVENNDESNFVLTQKLRKGLSEYLPEYMIPKKFIAVESMPITNNGKVDRKKIMEELT